VHVGAKIRSLEGKTNVYGILWIYIEEKRQVWILRAHFMSYGINYGFYKGSIKFSEFNTSTIFKDSSGVKNCNS